MAEKLQKNLSKITKTNMSGLGIKNIDYKDIDNLKFFITERGKILPRRITGVSFYFQRKLKQNPGITAGIFKP